MKRYILYIVLSTFGLGVAAQAASPRGGVVLDCGTLFTLSANANEGYHFVEWSDGSTEQVRIMEASEDAVFIAYFASNCGEWANWPVVTLYDWLIMLNVDSINRMGYFFKEEDVSWYRIEGEIDLPEDTTKDDELVSKGYYLTLGKDLKNTGDYYAEVDIAASGVAYVCRDVMRSVVIHYAAEEEEDEPAVELWPNMATRGEMMKLVGLNPAEETRITVYSATGHLVESFTTSGEVNYMLQAGIVGGCYFVHISSPSKETVLKYVVYDK